MSTIVSTEEFDDEEFRVNLGTMESDGSRKWIFPKKPKGKFYNYRTYVSWFLLAVMVAMPFITINGNQFFKFDIFNREFFIFSFPFFPQDLYLVAIGLIGTFVFIILFTQIYGRLFCGWICPQTIFLEMVFRKIEYMIDGDRPMQMRLAAQGWNDEKIMKRGLKWSIYLVISFLIANLFLAYILGADNLFELIKTGPIENSSSFIFVLVFTGVFYFIFSWFREQACTLVCPYGRLQGVLIDKNTIEVAYDFTRGESTNGRARFKKDEDRSAEGKGDCIDCKQCVVVCPTGIDIRNGSQLECVNCTACIDACDDVMTKINLPTGLIRYASKRDIIKKQKFKFRPRHFAYSILLVFIGVSFILLLAFRPDVDTKFFQSMGSSYVEKDGIVKNTYTYVFINKTNKTQKIKLALNSHKGELKVLNSSEFISLNKGEKIEGTVVVSIPASELDSYMDRIVIESYNEKGELIDKQKTNFLGPIK